MYRIHTKVSNLDVLTLFFPQEWKWITIKKVTIDNKITTSSFDSTNEYEAGQNHLRACSV